jgi:hypothetical protein
MKIRNPLSKSQADGIYIDKAIGNAKGDLIGFTASDTPAILSGGSIGQVLTADPAEATGLKWATTAGDVVGPASSVDGNVASFNGITGKLIQDSGFSASDIGLNTTHRSSDGTDHGFIDQSVTTTASPTFAGATVSGLTASRLIATNGSSGLSSVGDLTSWIGGTTGNIVVGDDGDGTVTLNVGSSVLTASNSLYVSNKNLYDSNNYIVDNSDVSARAQFSCNSITTGTTRQFIFPDSSGTLAITSDLSAYQPLDGDLTALSGITGTGILARTAADTYALRTIVDAGSSRISVTNGNGVSGNISLDVSEPNLDHNTIGGKQGGTAGEYYHLTSTQHGGLTGGGNTTLHIHDSRYFTETELGSTTPSSEGAALIGTDAKTNLGGATNVEAALTTLDGWINQDLKTSAIPTFSKVYVGAGSIDASAVLEADSTTSGFLPPRMTTAQRTAIGSPAEGLVVHDTDIKALFHYENGSWEQITNVAYVDAGDLRISTGAVSAPSFSDNGDGTASVGSTTVRMHHTTDRTGNLYDEVIPADVSLGPFTDNDSEWIVAEYNAGSPRWVIEADYTTLNDSDRIAVYRVWRQGTELHSLSNDEAALGLANKIAVAMTGTDPYKRGGRTGLEPGETSTPTDRTVTVSSALVFAGFNPIFVWPFNSSTDLLTKATVTTGTWSYTNESVYNNADYNPITGPTAMSSNRYSIRWLYRSVGDVKQTFYVMGIDEYTSVAAAQLEQPRGDLPDLLTSHCILVGRIIIQEGASSGIVESAWVQTFTGLSVISHNDTVNIQGGTSGERYHTTNAEHTALTTGADASAYHVHDSYYLPRSAWHGTFAESFDARVTSDGVTITMSLEQSGGGDLSMQFSDAITTFDCTPAQTIALTEGTVSSPQGNYIYIPQSTKVLTKSTSGWPSTEHIKIGFFFCQSAAQVATDGPLANQNWNDHLSGTANMGHITHIGRWIRSVGAKWFSGCDGGGTSGYITPAAGGGTIQVNAGVISQMHPHSFVAKDTSAGDDAHVWNYPAAAYTQITNLNELLVDSAGGSLTNRYYSIILSGVANKSGEYSPLLITLPAGSYNNSATAIADTGSYDDYSLPREFTKESSTAFLIARITLRNQGDTTFTVIQTQDLRGQDSAVSGGSLGGAAVTDFADSQFTIYNNVDPTKIIDFDLSGITTGNTRTITPADADMTIFSTVQYTDLTDGGDTTLHQHDGRYFTETELGSTTSGSEGASLIGTDTKANLASATNVEDALTATDSHVGSTSNPHSVTNTQVGLGNVTNDAQLKRAAGDINTFSEKVTPVGTDILLIEDSADSYNKKKVQITNLPGGGGGEANTASSAGAGTSIFYQKSGVDLQFNAIKSENDRLSVALDAGTHDVELTVNEANIVHQNLSGKGTNTHAQIDAHIGDSTIHFTQAAISIPASQISDFDTEVSNNADVTANTTHRSSDGTDHTYIDQDLRTTATPTFSTVTATTFLGSLDTNVAAAGLTVSETTIAADGTDATIDVTITPKGNAGVVLPNLGGAPSVTTSKLYQVSGVLYFDGVNLEAGGSATPGGADTNVQFNNSGSFDGDAEFVWDTTYAELAVGASSHSLNQEGSNRNYPLVVSRDQGDTAYYGGIAIKTGGNISRLDMARAQSSLSSPGIVTSSQILGQWSSWGYDGTNYVEATRVRGVVNGTPGSDDMPGQLEFYTRPDGTSQNPTLQMKIDDLGDVHCTNGLVVGTTSQTDQGMIRYDTGDFEGRTAAGWVSLTSGGGSSTFVGLTDTFFNDTATTEIYTTNGTPNAVIETTVVLTESTNTFNITKGTASLDIAAGSALDVNANLTVESASAINQDVTSDASPTWVTVNATTFDTNVAAAGLTMSGTTIAADGTDTHIDITITPKGSAGIVLPNAAGAPAVTTNKLYQTGGILYFDGVSLEAGGGGSGDVVGPSSSTDNALVRYDSTTGKLVQNSGTTLDDNDVLTLKANGGAVKFSTPGSDLNANGVIITGTVDTNSIGVGALLVLSSDGNWDHADANAATGVGLLGLAMETGTGAGKKILLQGIFRKDAWNWTVGGETSQLFVSPTTTGTMEQSPTWADTEKVQTVGYPISADVVYFYGSNDIAEYVA